MENKEKLQGSLKMTFTPDDKGMRVDIEANMTNQHLDMAITSLIRKAAETSGKSIPDTLKHITMDMIVEDMFSSVIKKGDSEANESEDDEECNCLSCRIKRNADLSEDELEEMLSKMQKGDKIYTGGK